MLRLDPDQSARSVAQLLQGADLILVRCGRTTFVGDVDVAQAQRLALQMVEGAAALLSVFAAFSSFPNEAWPTRGGVAWAVLGTALAAALGLLVLRLPIPGISRYSTGPTGAPSAASPKEGDASHAAASTHTESHPE